MHRERTIKANIFATNPNAGAPFEMRQLSSPKVIVAHKYDVSLIPQVAPLSFLPSLDRCTSHYVLPRRGAHPCESLGRSDSFPEVQGRDSAKTVRFLGPPLELQEGVKQGCKGRMYKGVICFCESQSILRHNPADTDQRDRGNQWHGRHTLPKGLRVLSDPAPPAR